MHASVLCFKSQWWMAAWLQQISYLWRLRAQEATKTQTSKRSSKGRLHLKSGYVCLSHWIISSFLKHYTENHILPRACKTAVTTAGPPWIWNSTLSSPEKLRGADETNKGITTLCASFSYLNKYKRTEVNNGQDVRCWKDLLLVLDQTQQLWLWVSEKWRGFTKLCHVV